MLEIPIAGSYSLSCHGREPIPHDVGHQLDVESLARITASGQPRGPAPSSIASRRRCPWLSTVKVHIIEHLIRVSSRPIIFVAGGARYIVSLAVSKMSVD
jgi:hypothetical protein